MILKVLITLTWWEGNGDIKFIANDMYQSKL